MPSVVPLGTSLVAGQDRPGAGPEFTALDPRTGAPVGPTYRASSPDDIADACAAAAAAFDDYRSRPLTERAAFLDAVAEEIEALAPDLPQRASLESGLPLARTTSELGRTTGQLRMFADVVRRGDLLALRLDPALPDRTPLPRPDLRLRMVPVGPVAVFGASNFPLAFSVAGGDTASALAAGCPVVAKAHPAHPGTSELVGRAVTAAVARCGLPAGVFSLVCDPGTEIGGLLVADPRIAAVGFTGSRRGGLALVDIARSRPVPIPVFAEMSSVNPVVVLPGACADPEGLATGYVASLTNGAGQFCTNPGLLFVPSGTAGDAVVRAVADQVTRAVGQPMLTEGIRTAYETATALRGTSGDVGRLATGQPEPAQLAPAPVLDECDLATFAARPGLADEVFGAAGLVVRYAAVPDLLPVLARLEGQLSATLHGTEQDLDEARLLVPLLERRAGRLLWGGWPTGVEVTHAIVHGGPFPSTSDARSTSVGSLAVERWLRPVSYQGFPDALLPTELRDGNPWGLTRRVDGVLDAR